MKSILTPVLLALAITTVSAQTRSVSYGFVSEYVRQLAESEDSRDRALKELAEPGNQLATTIRNSTRIMLQLKTWIGMLKPMNLGGRFTELPGTIASIYEQKIQVHSEFVQISKALIAGPQPGVDYGALAGRSPELTATLDHLDETLFKATPLIFATLIDQRPDRQGHVSRLLITLNERNELVRVLCASFGEKMDQKEQNYTVSSATLLRDFLIRKGFKCADEPL
jgi:hypothetical protein